jgi:hypothetical protein
MPNFISAYDIEQAIVQKLPPLSCYDRIKCHPVGSSEHARGRREYHTEPIIHYTGSNLSCLQRAICLYLREQFVQSSERIQTGSSSTNRRHTTLQMDEDKLYK